MMDFLEQLHLPTGLFRNDHGNGTLTNNQLFERDTWSWQFVVTNLAILTVSLAFLTAVRRRYFSPISHIPGPFVASFSRLWHLKHILGGKQQVVIAKAHEKYGPFMRLGPDEVSVCHPNAIKALFLSPLHKGEWYKIFVLPDYRTPAPLGIRNPKEKALMVKNLNVGFSYANIIRSEVHMDSVLTTFFGWLDKSADEKSPIRLGEFFSYAAYDITGEVTFSRTFGFTEKGQDIGGAIATNEAMELFFTVMGYFRWFSYLLCNPFTTWAELLPLGHMGAIAKSALEERRKNPDARFDISAHWFRALDKVGETNIHWNEASILAAAISNLGAGSDTVSCGMQSFVYHLLRHPTGWQRIRDEIKIAQKEGRCRDSIITYEDAAKLPYLQACLKEALRIFSPIPMGLPRVVPKGGLKFDDTFFPEGTNLSINPYVLMTSKALWGSDGDKFEPNRWFGDDVAQLEKIFCPWGAGWGSCPGQHIARIQMSKIAATLARDYDFKQVNPNEEWEWMAYFTIVPKGWPVYVTKVA